MKSKLIILFFLCSVKLTAQSYISVTADNGYMINADPGFLKMGLGTSVGFLIQNNLQLGAACNYFTFTASLINYPHTGVSYSPSHFNNDVDDAFNYVKLLVGYRISLRFPEENGSYNYYRGFDRIEGLSFEPNIGTALYNFTFRNPTVIISPRLNYVRKGFQLSAYFDYGQAKEHTNIGYRTIFSVGMSLGCNLKL